MIDLESHDDGVLLSVKAQPGGRRNAICGEHDGQIGKQKFRNLPSSLLQCHELFVEIENQSQPVSHE